MLKRFRVILIAIFIIIIYFPGYAKQAYIDMKSFDFDKKIMNEVDGEWEIHFGELLTPQELERENIESEIIKIPQDFRNKTKRNNLEFNEGYATLRTKLTNVNTKKLLALKMPRVFSAYKIWINGEYLGGVGEVGTSQKSEVAKLYSKVYPVTQNNNSIEIVIQISNFSEAYFGIWDSIIIGNRVDVSQKKIQNIISEVFFAGTIFFIGLYCIIVFLVDRKLILFLTFGLYCVLIVLRIISAGESIIFDILPNIPNEIARKIEGFTFYTCVPLFLVFIRFLYSKNVNRLLFRVIQIYGVVMGIIVVLTPSKFFFKILFLNQIFTLCLGLYIIFVVFKAFIAKEEGSFFVILGCVLLYIATGNDILYYMEVTNTGYYFHIGIFAFVLLYSFVLAIKYSNSIKLSVYNEKQYEIERERKEYAEMIILKKEKSLEKLKMIENMSAILFGGSNVYKCVNYVLMLLAYGFGFKYKRVAYFEMENDELVLKNICHADKGKKIEFNNILNTLNKYEEKVIEDIKEEKRVKITRDISDKILEESEENRFLKLDKEDSIYTFFKDFEEEIFIFPVIYNNQTYGMIAIESNKEKMDEDELEVIKIFSNSLAIYFEKIKIESGKLEIILPNEYRCSKCRKKLFMYKGEADYIEVKCPTCNTFNVFNSK